MHIAMWSGPRNLSTAMMYAFGARGDCAVRDEPFYGAYLAQTGIDHPMREAVLAACETDPKRVADGLLAPDAGGRPHVYQKHMTHHMLEGFDLGWTAQVTNVFLIRHPARVIASYLAKRENPSAEDLGFARQLELFDAITGLTGRRPPVVDAAEIRAGPADALAALCAAIGLGFTPAMLSWPAGGRAEDGPWAPHWYGAVHQSTRFAGPEGPMPEVPAALEGVYREALGAYRALSAHSLSVSRQAEIGQT